MTTRKPFDCCFLRIQIYLNIFFTSAFIHRTRHIHSQDCLQLNKVEDISLKCLRCTLWKTNMNLKNYQTLVVLRLLFFPLSSCGIFQLRPFRIKPGGCDFFSTAKLQAAVSSVSRAMRDPMLYRRALRKRKLGVDCVCMCLGDVSLSWLVNLPPSNVPLPQKEKFNKALLRETNG